MSNKAEVERLIALRGKTGMSYVEIAKRSGVPLSTVQKIFCHVTENPRNRTVDAIRRVLEEPFGLDDAARRELTRRREALPQPLRSAFIDEQERLVTFTGSGEKHIADYMDGKPVDYFLVREASLPYQAVRLTDKTNCTLVDYEAVPEDRRMELIDGRLYDMAAPTSVHQILTAEIWYQLRRYVGKKKGKCRPMIAPLDVQLDQPKGTPPELVDNMLQPDVVVYCNPDQLDEKRAYLAPDFVAEVLSPSTQKRDMSHKLWKYQRAGVREYWMVDPRKEKVVVYNWTGEGEMTIYGFDEQIPVAIYDGDLVIDFAEIQDQLAFRR